MSIATPSATLESFVYWTSDEAKTEKRRSLRKRYTEDEEDIVVEAEESELYPNEGKDDHENIEVIVINDDDDDDESEASGKGKEKEVKRPSVYVRLCEGVSKRFLLWKLKLLISLMYQK